MKHWTGHDGAALSAVIFAPEVINVGLDDRKADEQVDKVTQYVPFVSGALTNSGLGVASLREGFYCSISDENQIISYRFGYFDPATQKRVFPHVDANSSYFFHARLLDYGPPSNGWPTATNINSCVFDYADKFGLRRPQDVILAETQQNEIKSLALMQ